MSGLGFGFTNPVGTGGVLDVCLCLGCGGCCCSPFSPCSFQSGSLASR